MINKSTLWRTIRWTKRKLAGGRACRGTESFSHLSESDDERSRTQEGFYCL